MSQEHGFTGRGRRDSIVGMSSRRGAGSFGLERSRWAAQATPGVATGLQRDASELSDSLLNNPLWVNDPFRAAAREQPVAENQDALALVQFRTSDENNVEAILEWRSCEM